jgi:HlyD family secretion protein
MSVRLRSLWAVAAVAVLAGCNGSGDPGYQGWVEAELLFVGPDEAGRVQALAVREGMRTEAGAPLFTVDSDLQVSDLQAAVAAVAEARARLARLEGAQQRKEEIAVLEAQERRAQSALDLSTIELERQKTLNAKGIGAKAQLDIATANYNRDRSNLDEVRRQIQVARMSSREEDIAAARESLAAAEARRVAAETRLARRSVVSPAAGTIQQVYYRPGEMVPANRPVVALLPPANLKIRFFVPEAVLPRVHTGDVVAIRCDGCAGDLSARVDFIGRTAEYTPPVIYSRDERSKLVFLVEARPERPDAFRVGQPVSVGLSAGEAKR